MLEYLNYKFNDTNEFISTFDELPLWSASFGLLLFKHLELKSNITAVDIGSGAGFPLMELAERLGKTSKVYGVDPWKTANIRAKQKITNYQISNVELLECPAESIPLNDHSVDLIVSNLGINNFSDPPAVFKECHRILKPGGKLALTTNLFGHWKEFYVVFENTLNHLNKPEILTKLKAEEQHRGTIESITKLYTDAGFEITRHFEDAFTMHFTNGSAFLNHHFIKLGWLDSWLQIVPEGEREEVFHALESNLNELSINNGLQLSVPALFIEGESTATDELRKK